MRDGDFGERLPGNWDGIQGKLADTLNEIIFNNRRLADELARVGDVVGKRGQIGEARRRRQPPRRRGAMERSVNMLVDDLLWLRPNA